MFIDGAAAQVWERKTGKLVADLTGGHVGRIFCVGFDGAKVSDFSIPWLLYNLVDGEVCRSCLVVKTR